MNNFQFNKIRILFLLIFSIQSIFAQNFNKENGLPYIRNYIPEEYNAHEQNFDIVQDTSGIMYFANFSGILEFDGTNWNKITTKSGMRVLALDVDKSGRIYYSGLEDFGYIENLKNGQKKYISLTDSINESIGMVFQVICAENKVYFFSENTMFTYENAKIKSHIFDGKLLSAYLNPINKNEILLFFEKDFNNINKIQSGLVLFSKNNFIQTTDRSSSQIVDVQSVLPYIDNKTLVLGTSSQGMFLFNNNIISDFESEINTYIKNQGYTCGTQISAKEFAVGTSTGGILICNHKGQTIQIIDKKSNLQDQSINALYKDSNNSLWAATNNGISKIEVNWNISYIDNLTSGLNGKIQDILCFENKTYFASDNGLFFIENNEIKQVSNLNFACWDIQLVNNIIFAATTKGIYKIKDSKAEPTKFTDFSFCINQSKYKPDILYSGHNGRIDLYTIENEQLIKQNSIITLNGDVYKVADTDDGRLFAEVSPGKIYMYSFRIEKGSEIKPQSQLISLHISQKENDIFFTSEKGLFQYVNNQFIPYNICKKDTSSHKLWIHDLFQIDENTYIITDGEKKNMALYNIKDSTIKIIQTPFLPVSNFTVNTVQASIDKSVVWFGGKNGLILYKKDKITEYNNQFSTLIRSVKTLENDSLIDFKSNELIKLDFSENSLRFNFSAPVYVSKGKPLYRFFLKGFDKDTSDWTELTYKDYTNIPSGKYCFTVEAKNEFGMYLKKSSFDFQILIPVYRRWWTLIIYAFLLFGIIRIYMNWRIKAIKKERKVLEDTVKERTEEIEQSKEEIETQRDELFKQKQEIVDSINYAQRIQAAVLPSEELLNETLKNFFVFYKPRNIVSGDFYWAKKIKNFSFVVAADCTGHGVPGAFMSMLGSSFLNEIVSSRTLDSASNILNRLRLKVKKSLHQKGEEGEQKDGMDISLLIIDWDTFELQFAGAYNSLYIIRKNVVETNKEETYEVIKLKADRQPIGIYLHEKDFTNHSFQLKKEDTIYALSDGYVDQFGGDLGGKFKSGRFENMLLSFQDKSLEEQKHIINRTFTKWKRDIEQVDDVLIIGIKI